MSDGLAPDIFLLCGLLAALLRRHHVIEVSVPRLSAVSACGRAGVCQQRRLLHRRARGGATLNKHCAGENDRDCTATHHREDSHYGVLSLTTSRSFIAPKAITALDPGQSLGNDFATEQKRPCDERARERALRDSGHPIE